MALAELKTLRFHLKVARLLGPRGQKWGKPKSGRRYETSSVVPITSVRR
jgi:hypothetical protein